mmetsp:Transcript_139239/g.197162  ORF Transcript_139239/g.197162 Transcript_139239/m.197162 type:complete len:278 (+) Transcript_139239:357-1190(+)
MSQGHGRRLAVRANSRKCSSKVTSLEGDAEELYNRGPGVAFVAAQLVTTTSDGAQRTVALNHAFENAFGVRPLLSAGVDDHAFRRGLATSGVLLYLATLADGSSTVNHEGKGLVCRDPKAERVGSQTRLHSEGRGDGGPRVGAAEADAALRARHGGIVSGDAVVGRVPDGHEAKAIFFGLRDCHVHAVGAHVKTNAHVGIDQGSSFCLFDDVNGGERLQYATLDPVHVDGLQSADAMAVDPSLVSFDQHIGTHLRLLLWRAGGHETLCHELLEVVKV